MSYFQKEAKKAFSFFLHFTKVIARQNYQKWPIFQRNEKRNIDHVLMYIYEIQNHFQL